MCSCLRKTPRLGVAGDQDKALPIRTAMEGLGITDAMETRQYAERLPERGYFAAPAITVEMAELAKMLGAMGLLREGFGRLARL